MKLFEFKEISSSDNDGSLSFVKDVNDPNVFNILSGNDLLGCFSVNVFLPSNDAFNKPRQCLAVCACRDFSGHTLFWECQDASLEIKLSLNKAIGPEFLAGEFSATGTCRALVRLVWEFNVEEKGFPFVPGFMYGHNEGGKSPWATYPQLAYSSVGGYEKPWLANEWFCRTDRSSYGLTSIISNGIVRSIGGRDVCRYSDGILAEKTGIGVSSAGKNSKAKLSFSLGFGNIPYTYSPNIGRNFFDRPEGYADLSKGEVSVPIFITVFSSDSRHRAIDILLRKSYLFFGDNRSDSFDIKRAITEISEALIRYGYCPEAKNFYNMFEMDWKVAEHNRCFSNGWAGGVQVAYPLLHAGRLLDRKDWIECAAGILSNISENGINSDALLFYDNYNLLKKEWDTRGWWYEQLEIPGHSGYVNGQICYYLLQGFLSEQQYGICRETWFSSAKKVLDNVVANQDKDGRFGYTYSEKDGIILDKTGFGGAWFMPALANLHYITGYNVYLKSVDKAITYYRQRVEDYCVYGTPLDTFKAPDAEGIIAWIKALQILHEITKKPQYLEYLLMGINYELSWNFACNVAIEYEPLKSLCWRSIGGTITSANNPHIHPMNCSIIPELAYVVEVTKDDHIKSRLKDRINWALNSFQHYDGQFGWGKCGMMNERFCHTDALLCERFSDGTPASTWFCGLSWPAGSVLEGLANCLTARRLYKKDKN